MPAVNWYDFLTEAQPEVYQDVFSVFPEMGFSAPLLLTTADGGLTYTFGLDAGGVDLIRPMGHTELYPSLTAIPDDPLIIGEDFLVEGSLIRTLNHKARTFTAGPYARFTLLPEAAIDAATQPQLMPKHARMLLVWKALASWAARPGSGASPERYEAKYTSGKQSLFMELGSAYNRQQSGGGKWYNVRDLVASGGLNL